MRNDIIEAKPQILQWIKECKTKGYIASKLHCKQETLNRYLKQMGIEYDGQQGINGGSKKKTSVIDYIKNTNIKSYRLKYKLLDEGLKEYQCEYCGLSEWNNLPIPLELHHIDGNHHNNELSNLMLVCPNCHYQLTSQMNNSTDMYSYGYMLNKNGSVVEQQTRKT